MSVIVPVQNAGRFLGQQLTALAKQRVSEPWEVIVVDNRSTDGSRTVAEGFAQRLPLRVVDARERVGPAYARNVGAAAATSSKLLFLDADDEAAPGYVTALARALDSVGLVCARIDHRTLNPPWVRGAHGDEWQATGVDVALGFMPAAATCSLGARRTTFEAVGGFAEQLSAGEDIAFCWDVQLAGGALHFVPEAVLRYRYRDDLPSLYRQASQWGSALPLLYRRYRSAGMPRRVSVHSWSSILTRSFHARSRSDLAFVAVQLGERMGTLRGSLRYRVLYL